MPYSNEKNFLCCCYCCCCHHDCFLVLFIGIKQKNDAANGVAALAKSTKRKSLDYLLQQAEVFAHFVTNGSKIKSKKRKTLLDSDQP